MKWDRVLSDVADGVWSMIIEARSWEIEATIMQDLLACNFKLPANVETTPGWAHRGYDIRKLYADKAREVIMAWDIRMAGKLRELFPGHFPRSLRAGPLQADYDGDGDWAIWAEGGRYGH